MKKTYIIPQIEVVLMEHFTPIAQSPLQGGGNASGSGVINQGDEGDVKYNGDWDIFDYGDE